jgi:hypothetical protein
MYTILNLAVGSWLIMMGNSGVDHVQAMRLGPSPASIQRACCPRGARGVAPASWCTQVPMPSWRLACPPSMAAGDRGSGGPSPDDQAESEIAPRKHASHATDFRAAIRAKLRAEAEAAAAEPSSPAKPKQEQSDYDQSYEVDEEMREAQARANAQRTAEEEPTPPALLERPARVPPPSESAHSQPPEIQDQETETAEGMVNMPEPMTGAQTKRRRVTLPPVPPRTGSKAPLPRAPRIRPMMHITQAISGLMLSYNNMLSYLNRTGELEPSFHLSPMFGEEEPIAVSALGTAYVWENTRFDKSMRLVDVCFVCYSLLAHILFSKATLWGCNIY